MSKDISILLWKAKTYWIENRTQTMVFFFLLSVVNAYHKSLFHRNETILQAHCKPQALKVLPQGLLTIWMLTHNVCASFLVSFLSSQFLSPQGLLWPHLPLGSPSLFLLFLEEFLSFLNLHKSTLHLLSQMKECGMEMFSDLFRVYHLKNSTPDEPSKLLNVQLSILTEMLNCLAIDNDRPLWVWTNTYSSLNSIPQCFGAAKAAIPFWHTLYASRPQKPTGKPCTLELESPQEPIVWLACTVTHKHDGH